MSDSSDDMEMWSGLAEDYLEDIMNEQQYNNEGKGALWPKVSKNGLNFYSGEITINGVVHFLSAFNNDKYEEGGKLPRFNVLLGEPKNKQADPLAPARDALSHSDMGGVESYDEDIKVEDLPF